MTPTLRPPRLAAAALGALAVLSAFSAPPQADTGDARIARLSVAQLQAAYLACDEEASRSVLDAGSAATCSLVAERLQQRAFGGDFERLIAWWRVAKAERTRLASARAR